MKRQLWFFVVIAALSTAAFMACEGVETYVVGTEAKLTGLSIGNVRIPNMPNPIDGNDYEDEEFNLMDADVASAPLERDSDTVNIRLNPSVSTGARVEWGIGSQDLRPFVYKDRRVNATFEDADYLYFRITSEDGETTNYYRFAVWVRSPVTEISEVYIGEYETHEEPNSQGGTSTVVDIDERMMATIGSANPDLATAISNSNIGVLAIKINQSQNAEIKVTKYDSNSVIRYAVATTGSEIPSFGTSNKFNLTDYTFLYLEVTAENTVDKAYYKFRIEVGRIASIKFLTFIGKDNAELGVANTGTRAGSWGNVALGNFTTADMPATGFGLTYELEDPAATLTWALIANKNATQPATFDSPANLVFDGTKTLAIQIVSDNGKATRFYKIEVVLLAAAFTLHPKSDYYYFYKADTWVGNGAAEGKDKISWYKYVNQGLYANNSISVNSSDPKFTSKGPSTVQPLTAELDREVSGTYQWYEAESWYGGYGFDADGRILYFPDGESTAVPETGFMADAYHVNGFDEKKNVSLHNGGNQYYRLENPGRKITGQTGTLTNTKTIPPLTISIDKRPFIAGFTSDIHYYWVEITDTSGRTAVSKRAVIVSERDPNKKHHIVRLTDDVNGDLKQEKDEDGNVVWPGTARNQKVFTKQRETYKIPITLPADFNVNDYTVATVQALFFLKDGTPWIQNWTQGDIGFEAEDGEQLIYYNLTNNNGTLGLVGGGKEPGGGSLTKKPKYIIVKPAGEKPINEMPPFEADGVTPKPNNDAQGWFTGFIELVEVRFEGPAR